MALFALPSSVLRGSKYAENLEKGAHNIFSYVTRKLRWSTCGRAIFHFYFSEYGRGFASSWGHFSNPHEISTLIYRIISAKKLEWGREAFAETKYAYTKVGQKGDTFSKWSIRPRVVVKPLGSDGEAGREKWRDPSSKKTQQEKDGCCEFTRNETF